MALPPTIANNTIVSNISGQTAAPAANTLSQLLNAILGTVRGGIILNVNNTWTVLPPGSLNHVLQIRDFVPTWGPLSPVFDSMGPDGHAHGAIMFRGLDSWRALPAGAPGSFLQTQGSADPQWAQPASLVPTGVVNPFIGGDGNVPPGWVLAAGGTIGDAASGATTRAHADTVALWALLYNSWRDAQAPVSGGRSGGGVTSALADFNAHKTIRLPDLRGRVVAGKDDMGGAAAGRLTTAGSGVTGTALGATGGAETHTLTSLQMPQHSHRITDPGHVHQVLTRSDLANTGRAGAHAAGASTLGQTTQPATTGITIDNTGGGGAHNNTPPTIVLNYIIKL